MDDDEREGQQIVAQRRHKTLGCSMYRHASVITEIDVLGKLSYFTIKKRRECSQEIGIS